MIGELDGTPEQVLDAVRAIIEDIAPRATCELDADLNGITCRVMDRGEWLVEQLRFRGRGLEKLACEQVRHAGLALRPRSPHPHLRLIE